MATPGLSWSVDTHSLSPDDRTLDVVRAVIADAARRSGTRQQPRPALPGEFLLPPEDTYASKYNQGALRHYYSIFDEALWDDYQNALAMRRDGLINELMDEVVLPIVNLDHDIEVDDPEEPDQIRCASILSALVKEIPEFHNLQDWLKQDIHFGKSCVQVRYGKEMIKGRRRVTVVDHTPVQGDKIIPRYSGKVGILIYRGDADWTERYPGIEDHFFPTDRGTALELYNDFWADRFLISRYRPSDFDSLFEANMAAAQFGYGNRGRYYWAWNLRTEALGWIMDALQRVGASGMTYGTYEFGNDAARQAMERFIQRLTRDQWAVAPVMSSGQIPDIIKNIPVSPVGYDVLLQIVEYLDGILRRGYLGQNLSTQSASTGLGSGVASLQGDVREDRIRYHANCLEESHNNRKWGLIDRLIRLNEWTYRGKRIPGPDLPFRMRLRHQIDKKSGPEQIQAAGILHNIGVDLDRADLLEQAGLEAPKDKANVLAGVAPPQPPGPSAGQPAAGPAGPGPEGAVQEGEQGSAPPEGNPPHPEHYAYNGDESYELRRWKQTISASDVARLLQNQHHNRMARQAGRPGYSIHDLKEKWIVSDYYTLMKVPTTLAMPTRIVPPGDRTHSNGPLVIDVDRSRAGVPIPGSEPGLLVLDGKHRQAEAVRARQPDVWAWVGNRALRSVVAALASSPGAGVETAVRSESPELYHRAGPGTMLALALPAEAAEAILPGQPAANLHLTLFFFGRDLDEETLDRIRTVTGMVAASTDPLRGAVSGLGRFAASASSEGRDVVYASVDLPGLHDLRADLAHCLELAGVAWNNDHDFHPHVTLEYVEPGSTPSVQTVPRVDLDLGELTLATGGEEEPYTLGSGGFSFTGYTTYSKNGDPEHYARRKKVDVSPEAGGTDAPSTPVVTGVPSTPGGARAPSTPKAPLRVKTPRAPAVATPTTTPSSSGPSSEPAAGLAGPGPTRRAASRKTPVRTEPIPSPVAAVTAAADPLLDALLGTYKVSAKSRVKATKYFDYLILSRGMSGEDALAVVERSLTPPPPSTSGGAVAPSTPETPPRVKTPRAARKTPTFPAPEGTPAAPVAAALTSPAPEGTPAAPAPGFSSIRHYEGLIEEGMRGRAKSSDVDETIASFRRAVKAGVSPDRAFVKIAWNRGLRTPSEAPPAAPLSSGPSLEPAAGPAGPSPAGPSPAGETEHRKELRDLARGLHDKDPEKFGEDHLKSTLDRYSSLIRGGLKPEEARDKVKVDLTDAGHLADIRSLTGDLRSSDAFGFDDEYEIYRSMGYSPGDALTQVKGMIDRERSGRGPAVSATASEDATRHLADIDHLTQNDPPIVRAAYKGTYRRLIGEGKSSRDAVEIVKRDIEVDALARRIGAAEPPIAFVYDATLKSRAKGHGVEYDDLARIFRSTLRQGKDSEEAMRRVDESLGREGGHILPGTNPQEEFEVPRETAALIESEARDYETNPGRALEVYRDAVREGYTHADAMRRTRYAIREEADGYTHADALIRGHLGETDADENVPGRMDWDEDEPEERSTRNTVKDWITEVAGRLGRSADDYISSYEDWLHAGKTPEEAYDEIEREMHAGLVEDGMAPSEALDTIRGFAAGAVPSPRPGEPLSPEAAEARERTTTRERLRLLAADLGVSEHVILDLWRDRLADSHTPAEALDRTLGELAGLVALAERITPEQAREQIDQFHAKIDPTPLREQTPEQRIGHIQTIWGRELPELAAAGYAPDTPSARRHRASVQKETRGQWEQAAASRGMSLEEYQQGIVAIANKHLDGAEFYRNEESFDVVLLILDHGFKSQHETGESMGYYGPDLRRQNEAKVIGVPLDERPQNRPIFGYVDSPGFVGSNSGTADYYGGYIFRMKPEIRHRTTITLGDSLNHQREIQAVPIEAVHPVALFSSHRMDLYSLDESSDSTEEFFNNLSGYYSYMEAQYIGGVKPEHIDSLCVPEGWDDHRDEDEVKEFHDLLRAKGIKLYMKTYEGDIYPQDIQNA